MTESHLSNETEEMNDNHGLQLSITTATNDSIVEHWKVQYARFFNCPSSAAHHHHHHPSLTPLVKKSKGTWLSSFTSLADLKLLTDHSHTFRSIILTVNLVGNVIVSYIIILI